MSLPNYRPALNDGERHGIDVSHHNGEIDWARVAAADIDFVPVDLELAGNCSLSSSNAARTGAVPSSVRPWLSSMRAHVNIS